MRRAWRALAALVLSLWLRLAREGLVVRAILFPLLLSAATLTATLGVVVMVAPLQTVAMTPAAWEELRDDLPAHIFMPYLAEDPKEEVWTRRAWGGTDGHILWLRYGGQRANYLEGVIRRHRDAPWRQAEVFSVSSTETVSVQGGQIARIMGALFTLYGVVFGVGMVARDREDGSLAAEFSLPIPRWVPGLARWIAGSSVLAAFFAYSVLLWSALFGVDEVGAIQRSGVAASLASVAVGLLVLGDARMGRGFSGALSKGLMVGAGLLGVGMAWPAVGVWLPIASLTAHGGGWVALALSLALGPLAAWSLARGSQR
ncbi:MAG: ABC transporter permease subunit [Deltaproteobacteria bacterium]|nr:ABC transporter permease subunit [Deltaproteobacteria bacterium]